MPAGGRPAIWSRILIKFLKYHLISQAHACAGGSTALTLHPKRAPILLRRIAAFFKIRRTTMSVPKRAAKAKQ